MGTREAEWKNDYQYILTVLDETSTPVQRHYLKAGEYLLGSAAGADIRIAADGVSRHHASLRILADGELLLRDLDSTNGTFVDQQRIKEIRLRQKTLLRFAGTDALLLPADSGSRIAIASPDTRMPPYPDEPEAGELHTRRSSLEGRLLEELGIHAWSLVSGRISREDYALRLCRDWSLTLAAESMEITGAGADGEAWILASARRAAASGAPPVCYQGRSQYRMSIRSLRPASACLLPAIAELALNLLDAGPAQDSADRSGPISDAPDLPAPGSLNAGVLALYRTCARVAAGTIPVMILGASGSGKDVLARWIHQQSGRRGEFLALNCATLGRDLLEAELFGVEKGAATGVKARAGVLELANGGTVFLDELGDMPAETQARLLRALEDPNIYRVGGRTPIAIDVRFIAATNQALEQKVAAGEFRLDLFHRLAAFDVTLPALRDRPEDIPLLATHFFEQAKRRNQMASPGITRAALSRLLEHDWPGNIRELRNEMERAVLLLDPGQPLDVVHLSRRLQGSGTVAAEDTLTLEGALKRAEREAFAIARAASHNDPRRAMRLLGLSRTSYYRRLKLLGEEKEG